MPGSISPSASTRGDDRDDVMANPEQVGGGLGILEAVVAGKLGRHHHAPHLVGAERVDRDGGGQRAVDPARHAEDDAGKAIVARHSRAGRPSSRGRCRAGRDRARPARAFRSASRWRSLAQSVTSSASSQSVIWTTSWPSSLTTKLDAVEHDLVLPADAVEVGERQPGLGGAGADERQAAVVLVKFERAAVGDEQHVRARPRRARAHTRWSQISSQIGTPSLTPRHSIGARQRAAGEDALFVEGAVIGQFVLERAADDLAALGQHHRVVDRAVGQMERAEQQGRAAVGGGVDQPLGRPRSCGGRTRA